MKFNTSFGFGWLITVSLAVMTLAVFPGCDKSKTEIEQPLPPITPSSAGTSGRSRGHLRRVQDLVQCEGILLLRQS